MGIEGGQDGDLFFIYTHIWHLAWRLDGIAYDGYDILGGWENGLQDEVVFRLCTNGSNYQYPKFNVVFRCSS